MAVPFDGIRRNISTYVSFSDEEFDRFASFLQHRHLERKQSLLNGGEVCWFEGYVVSGCLRIHHTGPDGWEFVLDFAPENQWIWDIDSFATPSPAQFAIDALEPTDVLLIRKTDKEHLFRDVPQSERLFRILTERAVRGLQRRLIDSMHETAEVRYLEFKRRFPQLEGRVAQHQVAAYLGISPEFLSRIRHRHVELVQ